MNIGLCKLIGMNVMMNIIVECIKYKIYKKIIDFGKRCFHPQNVIQDLQDLTMAT